MKMMYFLMAQYDKPVVELDVIASEYLGIDNPQLVKRKASKGDIPFPVFKLGDNKSPWMVSLQDLADWIEKKRDTAKADLIKLSA
ncbi:MAG: pyocin activator PrtN family protein [Thiomicrorhabdus sp.]|jgi:ATP-dependent RNA circularization protein (DNA/RNA ligase family)|nr:pyocin activator PrtN family protein [Thiomicrorhabdus sp.]